MIAAHTDSHRDHTGNLRGDATGGSTRATPFGGAPDDAGKPLASHVLKNTDGPAGHRAGARRRPRKFGMLISAISFPTTTDPVRARRTSWTISTPDPPRHYS
ncbi:hypothetical protein GCM10009608_43340 [Pseudonocardia alaniniphila]